MNIFVLDENPELAAKYHCDRHVVKMIVESAQMLSTSHATLGSPLSGIYKPAHVNHPCTIWARESYENYLWLLRLSHGLVSEYHERYGDREHKTEVVLEALREVPGSIPDVPSTPFAQAVPDYCRNENPVLAYRQYYMTDKRHIAQWKNGTPHWYL